MNEPCVAPPRKEAELRLELERVRAELDEKNSVLDEALLSAWKERGDK